MIIRCGNCKEIKDKSGIQTVLSASSSGAILVVHLCRKCAKNEGLLKKVMAKQDLKLTELDNRIKFREVSN